MKRLTFRPSLPPKDTTRRLLSGGNRPRILAALDRHQQGEVVAESELFVVFKASRVYYGGLGYRSSPPMTKEKAQQWAAELTAGNPVGFQVLPYSREPIIYPHL